MSKTQCSNALVIPSPGESQIRCLGFTGQPAYPQNSESQAPARDLAPKQGSFLDGPERWLSSQRHCPPKCGDLGSFLQDSHRKRREGTHMSCPLTSTFIPGCMHVSCPHTRILNKEMQQKLKTIVSWIIPEARHPKLP